MLIIDNAELMRQQSRLFHQQGLRVAMVPTMGNLHEGHLRLVAEAAKQADVVVVSIFVNPMQFERDDDLRRYPRTLQQDCEKLKNSAVAVVFAPPVSELYPHGHSPHSSVDVPPFSAILEGASRPGHFRGVTTVLCKLFNLLVPDMACFGEKDYQQLHIVRRMVRDLNYDIEIIAVPTVRDERGLALSSRNHLLTAEQLALAPALYQCLQQLAARLSAGEHDVNLLQQVAGEELSRQGFQRIELHICDAQTLLPLAESSQRAVILLAAWLGNIRLIDNQQLTLPASHRQSA